MPTTLQITAPSAIEGAMLAGSIAPLPYAGVVHGTREGGCQCGRVRYRISGEPLMAAICHCTMCRRANAAPAIAWAMFHQDQVVFLGDQPASYPSSAESRRGFCGLCGTQISFTADYLPGLIDITIGSLDQPELLAPTLHYWGSERLPWLHLADDLPQFPEFPPIA